ncbi:hypothetical protein [Aquipuribacter sp. MA13-6]|uniref:hypothetical protein n=1 Tax=Aquipuribacter sp. MA13-6 TaxID=3440839 RepID=UPI003EED81C5
MDLDDLRALARSAPWRWRTLRLAVTWHGGQGPDGPLPAVEGDPVRAWVDGRHGLRVEDLATGRLLSAEWEESPGGWRPTGRAGAALAERRGLPVQHELGEWAVGPADYGVDDPRAPRPTLRGDGLVAARPAVGDGPDDGLDYGNLPWRTYQWVAMLDPWELADGSVSTEDGGRGGRDPAVPPVRLVPPVSGGPLDGGPPDGGPLDGGPPDGGPLDGGPPDGGPLDGGPPDGGPLDGGPPDGGPLDGGPPDGGPLDGGPPDGGPADAARAVDHQGRAAWEAVVAPTAAYDPRCSCCPLLPGEVASRRLLADGGASPARLDGASSGWPTAHRVRLDAATGVVVELEQVDGHGAGQGWTAVVEAVDERYDRSVFGRPPRAR